MRQASIETGKNFGCQGTTRSRGGGLTGNSGTCVRAGCRLHPSVRPSQKGPRTHIEATRSEHLFVFSDLNTINPFGFWILRLWQLDPSNCDETGRVLVATQYLVWDLPKDIQNKKRQIRYFIRLSGRLIACRWLNMLWWLLVVSQKSQHVDCRRSFDRRRRLPWKIFTICWRILANEKWFRFKRKLFLPLSHLTYGPWCWL